MSSTKLPHKLYLAPQTLIFLDVQQRILENAPRLCIFLGNCKASKIGIVRARMEKLLDSATDTLRTVNRNWEQNHANSSSRNSPYSFSMSRHRANSQLLYYYPGL